MSTQEFIGLIELELGQGIPELEYVYLNQNYVKINIIMNLFIGYFFQGKSSLILPQKCAVIGLFLKSFLFY